MESRTLRLESQMESRILPWNLESCLSNKSYSRKIPDISALDFLTPTFLRALNYKQSSFNLQAVDAYNQNINM